MFCGLARFSGKACVLLCALSAFSSRLLAQDQPVYSDSLQNAWVNWSWATVNVANTSPVHAGANSISVSSAGWEALYLHHDAQSSSGFNNLTFWINGGAGGQIIHVRAHRNGVAQGTVVLAPLSTTWRQETISLVSLGVANAADFDGFWLQVQSGVAAPTFYVDDIVLVGGTNPPPPSVTNAPITITVNAALNRRSISPLIYGVAFASSNDLAELNAPINRSGGNAETRYNWVLNARNHASDWYFQSLEAGPATPGGAGDSHVAESKNGGGDAILTVPMIGWMPKLGPGRGKLSSYSIAKYGTQTDNDWQWFADAGNGVGTNPVTHTSWLITTNNPTDAHFLTNSSYQQAWIRHLTNKWGLSTNGGVRFYCMDNEHALWNSTHRDVHPVGTTMQEIRDKFFDYGGKVKDVDANALLLAPEEWGWNGYFYSGYDAAWATQNGDWNPAHFPDRNANGGMDYMPWFLEQARQYETNTGRRLLDYFTLHIYPQEGEFSNDTSAQMQLRRNRSTRVLWDTNYVDTSWINSVVKLIPRMRAWVTNHYPGTPTGITEYNWGAETHINGATAQADIYGIFGREGLDLATRWTTPSAASPTFKAMKMYRNYDGNRSTFGDTSVLAGGGNPDNIATFAALRASDGALTVMAINKQLGSNAPATFAITNYPAIDAVQVWRLTSANVIQRLGDTTFAGGGFSNMLPAQSITLFVLSPKAPALRDPTVSADGVFRFWLDGMTGQRYVIQSSSDFADWNSIETNILAADSAEFSYSASDGERFYRAQRLP